MVVEHLNEYDLMCLLGRSDFSDSKLCKRIVDDPSSSFELLRAAAKNESYDAYRNPETFHWWIKAKRYNVLAALSYRDGLPEEIESAVHSICGETELPSGVELRRIDWMPGEKARKRLAELARTLVLDDGYESAYTCFDDDERAYTYHNDLRRSLVYEVAWEVVNRPAHGRLPKASDPEERKRLEECIHPGDVWGTYVDLNRVQSRALRAAIDKWALEFWISVDERRARAAILEAVSKQNELQTQLFKPSKTGQTFLVILLFIVGAFVAWVNI